MSAATPPALRPLCLAFASAALLLAPPSTALARDGWVRVVSPDAFYEAWLPGEPRTTRSSRFTLAGRATTTGFQLTRGHDGCDVTSTPLPAAVRWLGGAGWVYGAARESVLEESRGEEISYGDWRRGSVRGKALEWRGEDAAGRAEFYIENNRVYVFSCWARGSAALVEGFFELLTLREPS